MIIQNNETQKDLTISAYQEIQKPIAIHTDMAESGTAD